LNCVWSDVVPHRGHQRPRLKRVSLPTPLNTHLPPPESSSSESAPSPITPSTEFVKQESIHCDLATTPISYPTSSTSGSSTFSWEASSERAAYEAKLPTEPFSYSDSTNPLQFNTVRQSKQALGSDPLDSLRLPSPSIPLDNSHTPYLQNFELSYPSSGISTQNSYAPSSTGDRTATSIAPASNDLPVDSVQQVSTSMPPPISMPAPILADSLLYTPAWLEILDPVAPRTDLGFITGGVPLDSRFHCQQEPPRFW